VNRREALIRIPLVAAGAVMAYAGIKWASLNSKADIAYLQQSRPLLASLADTLIPGTDTPAASECGVVDFMIRMIDQGSSESVQNKFVDGVKNLEHQALSTYRKPFHECTTQQRVAILENVERDEEPWFELAGKVQRKVFGPSFPEMYRRLIVVGYFSSEAGATQALRYEHVPGRYIACQSYQPGQKAWATH
jgi:hypothetical protein